LHTNPKARRRGIVVTVRFYVLGLPSAKRSKWQQPLCWAATEVLRRQGVEAEVQGGELRVRQSEEAFIRVDFAPGRLPVADSEERPCEQLLAA
jgi:hypothetical protein